MLCRRPNEIHLYRDIFSSVSVYFERLHVLHFDVTLDHSQNHYWDHLEFNFTKINHVFLNFKNQQIPGWPLLFSVQLNSFPYVKYHLDLPYFMKNLEPSWGAPETRELSFFLLPAGFKSSFCPSVSQGKGPNSQLQNITITTGCI